MRMRTAVKYDSASRISQPPQQVILTWLFNIFNRSNINLSFKLTINTTQLQALEVWHIHVCLLAYFSVL